MFVVLGEERRPGVFIILQTARGLMMLHGRWYGNKPRQEEGRRSMEGRKEKRGSEQNTPVWVCILRGGRAYRRKGEGRRSQTKRNEDR